MTKSKDKGFAFITAIFFMLISMAGLIIVNTKLNTLVDVYRSEIKMANLQPDRMQAAAAAIGLLQTGTPPQNVIEYKLVLKNSDGAPVYKIKYDKKNAHSWNITVSAGGSNLPDLPESFNG